MRGGERLRCLLLFLLLRGSSYQAKDDAKAVKLCRRARGGGGRSDFFDAFEQIVWMQQVVLHLKELVGSSKQLKKHGGRGDGRRGSCGDGRWGEEQ